MGHKTDPLDFILDPGNSVKRSKDLNKARKLARKVANNRVIKIRFRMLITKVFINIDYFSH